jgi:hypothetical protein
VCTQEKVQEALAEGDADRLGARPSGLNMAADLLVAGTRRTHPPARFQEVYGRLKSLDCGWFDRAGPVQSGPLVGAAKCFDPGHARARAAILPSGDGRVPDPFST